MSKTIHQAKVENLQKSLRKAEGDLDQILSIEDDERASIAQLLDGLREKLRLVWRCTTTEFEINLTPKSRGK